MALRNRIPDRYAQYPDPIRGVNLRKADEDVEKGESPYMKNCVYDGGIAMRLGSGRLTASSLAASFRVRGGHKFYDQDGTAKRLIAYDDTISHITEAGAENVLSSGMTSDKDTHFTTWSITDKVYIANETDELQEYDGTTFQAVSSIGGATNVPGNSSNPPAKMVVPVSDRLLGITSNGIERTDARVAHVWSLDSSWATLRPSQVGPFTALAPFTVRRNSDGEPVQGAVAFQANAHYFISGTDFGDDVTSATASSNEDSAINIIDSRVGTSSPYSVVTVPGLGLFWVTSDLNVYFLPFGSTGGAFIGDKIQSNVDTLGLNNANLASQGQIWMEYFGRRLYLGFPTGSNTYPTYQYWLDIRRWQEIGEPVWYGPMLGQSLSRVWAETQGGDRVLRGGEGDPSVGVFVYELLKSGTYTDAVGTDDNNVDMEYRTHFEAFVNPSKKKYFPSLQLEANTFSGSATVDIYDLDGVVASNLAVQSV